MTAGAWGTANVWLLFATATTSGISADTLFNDALGFGGAAVLYIVGAEWRLRTNSRDRAQDRQEIAALKETVRRLEQSANDRFNKHELGMLGVVKDIESIKKDVGDIGQDFRDWRLELKTAIEHLQTGINALNSRRGHQSDG